MGDAHMSSGDSVVQQNHATNKKNCKKASSSGLHNASSESCSTSVRVQASTVKDDSFVLSLDVGTTTIRAHVYDQTATRRGTGSRNIHLIFPQPGWVEMDEYEIWQQAQDVIKDALADAYISAENVKCMGITTQRNTFITWDKETGEPFHHFITWQDLRASEYVKSWNDSRIMKALSCGSKAIYLATGKKRYLAASVLRYKSAQVVMRLKWEIDHNERLRHRIESRQVMFGCLDTWLLWQLTGKRVFASEYSCASSTVLFDPYQMEWSKIVSSLVGIPLHILPPLMDTSGLFGECIPELFGASIPITAMVADQQSAMFGQCCFEIGDVKCTMGTGTFIDCNTGQKPHASIAGLYPLIGWKMGEEITFLAEGFSADTGNCMEWARTIGLFNSVEETEEMAQSVTDSGGVYFVPAFSGLQMPINDDGASSLMIGMSLESTKQHVVRALLESLAFRFQLLHQTVLNETTTPLSTTIKCDGGVCNNSFLVQQISDITGCCIDRPEQLDMTSLGAAFLAGLAVGVWKSKSELVSIRRTQRLFKPSKTNASKLKPTYDEWMRAVERAKHWNMTAKS